MKETNQITHKMTFDTMSGFRIFWGIVLGLISLFLVLSIPTIIFLIILYFSGSV